jgi:hypothetical protein
MHGHVNGKKSVTHVSINKQLPGFQMLQRSNLALQAKGLNDVFSLEIPERPTQRCVMGSCPLPTDWAVCMTLYSFRVCAWYVVTCFSTQPTNGALLGTTKGRA